MSKRIPLFAPYESAQEGFDEMMRFIKEIPEDYIAEGVIILGRLAETINQEFENDTGNKTSNAGTTHCPPGTSFPADKSPEGGSKPTTRRYSSIDPLSQKTDTSF